MARAKREDCLRLVDTIVAAKLSMRQVGELYAGWVASSKRTREALLADPLLYLRARKPKRAVPTRRPSAPAEPGPAVRTRSTW